MKKFFLVLLLCGATLWAKMITPSDVYAQTELIEKHVHFLLDYYGIEHDDAKIRKAGRFTTRLKPRNVWQKGYEILVKINMFRLSHGLSRIEPIGMDPVEKLNPDMVYGQTQRILTEIKIAEVRLGIVAPDFEVKSYTKKRPLDVYNKFTDISAAFDVLNRSELSPSYVFAETMRVYDDLTIVLNYLGIKDDTIPTPRLAKATPNDSLKISMRVLKRLQKLQRMAGIANVDFSEFDKKDATPSDVYTIVGIILSELQPLKAYIGLTKRVTPPALRYFGKVPADIEQLMGWNFRKLSLIKNLERR